MILHNSRFYGGQPLEIVDSLPKQQLLTVMAVVLTNKHVLCIKNKFASFGLTIFLTALKSKTSQILKNLSRQKSFLRILDVFVLYILIWAVYPWEKPPRIFLYEETLPSISEHLNPLCSGFGYCFIMSNCP